MIEVGRRHSHAGLFAPLVVIGDTGQPANLFEALSLEIVEVEARRGIARDVDVRPAIVVEIPNQRSEAVVVLGRRDVHPIRDIGKVPVPIILIEGDRLARQASRTADDRQPLPFALRLFSRMRCLGRIELDVVGHDQIQRSIPVEVHKSASCTPACLRRRQTPRLRLILKLAVALVAIKNVLSPLRDEEIDIAVVVDVPGANSLPPSRVRQSSFGCDIFKLQAAQVVIEQWSGCAAFLKAIAVDEKNVGQTIVVVVEDCDSRAGGLDDVLLILFRTGDIEADQPGLGSDVFIAHHRRLHSRRQRLGRRGHAIARRHSHLRVTQDWPERS